MEPNCLYQWDLPVLYHNFFHITCTIVETCNSFLFLWVYNSLAITRVAEDSQRSPPLSINTLIIASRQVVRVL